MLGIFEMVETGDDRTCCAASATVLEPVQLGVVVWLGEGGKHEVVGILEEGMGRWLVGGIEDTELDDGRWINGTTVGCWDDEQS